MKRPQWLSSSAAYMLLLLPLLATGLKTPDSYLVEGLEEIEPSFATFNGSMYAGMVPIEAPDESDSAYMFWFFAPDELEPDVEDTIVIWLNGGPGCTSFNAGLLFETAPVTTGTVEPGSCCIDKNAPLIPNPHAWTKATNMLYVEQPAGTGFSYGPMPKDEEELSAAMHSFLVNFLTIFDSYANHRIYFVGESYAGMYVPSIAHYIYKANKKPDTPMHINLAGIGLGNGLIDVTQQTTPMIDYAYFHGLIDSKQRQHFYNEWEHCYVPGKEDAMQPEPKPYHSFNVPDECGIMTAIAEAAGKSLIPGRSLNVYDVTTWDPYASLSHVKNGAVQDSTNTRFLNDPRVKAALHAPEETFWMGCMPGQGRRRRLKHHAEKNDDDAERGDEEGVHPILEIPAEKLLDQDRPISMSPYIAELLDEGNIDVLVYNGDRDMACCAQGSEAVLDTMKWKGAGDWDQSERGLWLVDKEMAGYAKIARNLTFVIVFNSGHMVPTNQPVNALDLVTRLVTRKPFLDVQTPEFAYTNTDSKKSSNRGGETEMSGMSFKQIISTLVALAIGLLGGYMAARRGKNDYASVPDV